MWLRRLGLPLAAVLLTLPAAARAQAPAVAISPNPVHTGWLGVQVHGPAGARVTLSEEGRALRTVQVGASGTTAVTRLSPWRCDRRTRTIAAAVAGGAPASVAIATPSCDGRFALLVRPRPARAGRPLRVRVSDRWATGDARPAVCLRMRGHDVDCAGVPLRGAARTVRLHPVRAGAATVTLAAPGVTPVGVAVRVRRRIAPLRVLAAGDSMIQVLDAALARRMPRAHVRSDAHVSTGITKPSMLNWPARARRTARERRPDATVVFLGANDGFGLPAPGGGGQVPCCAQAWVDAYATRARAMMRAYARDGAGRVYWLTLPAPRGEAFARVFDGVNAALRQAARGLPAQVRLIDTGKVFTPGGRFRQTLRRDGRTIDVRQADGVHLSPAGDAIAAGLVVRAMRRDGLV